MQNHTSFTNEQDERPATIEGNGREQQAEELRPPPETFLPAGVSSPPTSWRPPARYCCLSYWRNLANSLLLLTL
jgi:hypothetical protein